MEDFLMAGKPTYKELEQEVKDLEKEAIERKLAAEALRESEEKYRTILENIEDGYFEVDIAGNFTLLNNSLCEFFGLPKDKLMGRNFRDFADKETNKKGYKTFNKVYTTGKPAKGFDWEVTRKDSTKIFIEASVSLRKDSEGKPIGFQGILRDITERKQAEESLKRSEKKYSSLIQIGLALSAKKDINNLLEMIVYEARRLTNADAGTLYLLDNERKHLQFRIMQNDTLNARIGISADTDIHFPQVPLYKNGEPNYSNVCSFVALTEEKINIADVYEAEGFNFEGTRNYDTSTGYRSKSVLVIPMKNHESEIIGVLELINAQNPENGEVVKFSAGDMNLVASLASQAAMVLNNTQLILELNNLLYAFIKSIAAAIDEKSSYTGGHINRVVDLTMMIAEKINVTNEGHFKDVNFSEDEVEELRLSAWMHDVGKITTPEHVVDKAAKLQTIFDRFNFIKTRFHLIEKSIENRYLHRQIKLQNGNSNSPGIISLNKKLSSEIRTLHKELEFIKVCNYSDEFISDDKIKRIMETASKTYSINDENYPYLTEDETENLCIRKGNLTDEERKVIEKHVLMTLKMLKQLSFPKKLSKVPEYASGHHERMDGSGYHQGLSKKALPLQTRILAFADIFEALTAKDRPYRKPMKLSQAVETMNLMVKDKHIDANVYDLFINSRLYYDYANKFMNPEQIDV